MRSRLVCSLYAACRLGFVFCESLIVWVRVFSRYCPGCPACSQLSQLCSWLTLSIAFCFSLALAYSVLFCSISRSLSLSRYFCRQQICSLLWCRVGFLQSSSLTALRDSIAYMLCHCQIFCFQCSLHSSSLQPYTDTSPKHSARYLLLLQNTAMLWCPCLLMIFQCCSFLARQEVSLEPLFILLRKKLAFIFCTRQYMHSLQMQSPKNICSQLQNPSATNLQSSLSSNLQTYLSPQSLQRELTSSTPSRITSLSTVSS